MKIIEILVVLILAFFLYSHFTGENPAEKVTGKIKGVQKTYTDSVEKLDMIKDKVDKNYEDVEDK